MKYLRPIIIIIFFIISIIFVIHWYQDKHAANTSVPVIEIKGDVLECSVKDDEHALLQDVIAYDKEDGDLTSRLVIEAISKFVDKKEHICNVTYTVEDSEHHVTKASRKIKFTDYESPRFTLSKPLCFDVGSDTTVVEVLGATDVYDGDISRNIKILSNNGSTRAAGEYTVTAQVTNRFGDTAKFKSLVVIKQSNNLSPTIQLTENVVYLKVGDSFKPEDYVQSVKNNKNNDMDKALVEVVNTNVDIKKAGYYSVEYAINPGEKNEGSTYLTVIVED